MQSYLAHIFENCSVFTANEVAYVIRLDMLLHMVYCRYMNEIGLLFDLSPLLSLITQVTVCAKVLLVILVGAAAPGFNSLIPVPNVPSLISTEPVQLLCRASNISSTDPFCFVKQKTGSG